MSAASDHQCGAQFDSFNPILGDGSQCCCSQLDRANGIEALRGASVSAEFARDSRQNICGIDLNLFASSKLILSICVSFAVRNGASKAGQWQQVSVAKKTLASKRFGAAP